MKKWLKTDNKQNANKYWEPNESSETTQYQIIIYIYQKMECNNVNCV